MNHKKRIAIITNTRQITSIYCQLLEAEYQITDLNNPDHMHPEMIIVIGGDGTMLHTIHKYMHLNLPFYGINTGNLGFLMNKTPKIISSDSLKNKISTASKVTLKPLKMIATDVHGKQYNALAINEISLLRQTHQTSKVSIQVNEQIQLNKLIGDGVLISTPAGSTAYNYSAGGPIIPINANLFAITPINPFRPRRWHGALVQNNAKIVIKVLDPKSRPVSVTADYHEVRNIESISASISNKEITLLFNCDYDFEYKTLREQFNH